MRYRQGASGRSTSYEPVTIRSSSAVGQASTSHPLRLPTNRSTQEAGDSARLVISPEYFDVDGLSLSESGTNRIDSTNPIGASDSESEFHVSLEAGEVFLGGELTGVREFASGCDVSADPDACPAVLRSPYFAVISSISACNDGIDNDGDTLIDFPDDPGCIIAAQDFEDPACDDGVNNDGAEDSLIDFPADPDCVAAWDGSEAHCGLGFELAFCCRR